MPRKSNKTHRKTSYEESRTKVKYQEKPSTQWRCGVCEQIYEENQMYCVSCYQTLYYFSFINNSMFVTKDDSYLETFFNQHSDDSFSLGSDGTVS